MKRFLAVAVLASLPMAAFASKPITEKETVTIKATIDAIEREARLITFKDKDGNYETIYAGPEVKRFDELKVGDKVTFKYTESIVFQLRKPGEPAPASGDGEVAIVRNPTEKPSGSMTEQATATVTVKAIDKKVPSVTVETEDGRTMLFKVEKKDRLKGVAPGDRVVITYTTALLVSVE
jgi:Cu/Ag efflux protein CusF